MAKDKLLVHSLVYFAGRAAPAAVTLASVPFFIQYLGTVAYGRYALYASLAVLCGNASGSWLSQAVLRHATRLNPNLASPYRVALQRGKGFSVTLAGTSTLLGGLLLPLDLAALVIASIASATTALFIIAFSERQADLDVQSANGSELARTLLGVCAPWVLMLSPMFRVPATLLGGMVLGNLCAIYIIRNKVFLTVRNAKYGDRKSKVIFNELIKFGAPISVWVLLSSLLNVGDRYIIEYFRGTSEVGEYSAVYDVVFKGMVFLMAPVLLAMHPAMMAAWNESRRHEAFALLRKSLLWSSSLALAAILVIYTLAPFIADFVVDSRDDRTVSIILPIAIGSAVWQLALLIHKPLEILRHTRSMLVAALIALIANIAINIAYVPTYGALAAAYATMISPAVYVTIVLVMIKGRA